MDLSIIYNLVSDATRILTWILANELKLVSEVDQKFRLLNVELQNMEYFLKNFEKKRKDHDHVKVVVNQIRDAAYEAEDIVNEFVINVAREKRKTTKDKVLGIIHKGTKLHDFGDRIDRLNAVIQKIWQDKDKFANEQGESSIDRDAESQRISREKKLQEMRQKVEEDGVVGFVKEANTLAKQLIQGTDDLKVISISGMGGLGKTTLAKKVCRDRLVTDHFRCRAWVSISEKFNAKQFLQRIVREISHMGADETENMREYQLKEELTKQLSDVRYLIVLDDIWEIDHWDSIAEILPKNQKGSRIFITTREAKVARHAGDKHPIPLRFLDDGESLELLTKKVFRGRSCPDDLISLAKEILKTCGGLPLAIVVSAGILGQLPEKPDVWKDMAKTISVHLEKDATCDYILGLSYEVLPSYLKPCFLYIGLFPEDYQISAKQLIQLWIAEGCIRDEDTDTLTKEGVARTYLLELIDRSLVQVEERSSNGGVKKCRVHDLTRKLCLQLSRPDRFLEYHSSIPTDQQNKPRRLSIHCSRENYMLEAATTNSSNTHQVRTLLCFKEDNGMFAEEHWKALFSCFKLLRVLDLGEGDVHSIPKKIEKLILLKYLKIKTNDVAALPPSICTLFNLQTLDLRRTRISNLPEGIWKMQQLRHLYLGGRSGLPQKKDESRFLSKLQTLSYILQDRNGKVKISEMAPNLRKLGLWHYRSCSGDQDSVFKLPYLETLKFENKCIFDNQITLPKSIEKISIKTSNLSHKTMEVLQNLSTLQILKLDDVTFNDNVLDFKEGSFRGLQLFKIENSKLKDWELKPGAAPNLKRVVISNCRGLKRVSEQLWELPELQKLELLCLREDFTKEIVKTKNDKVDVMIYPNILESRV